jgi:hypothetical protein
MTGAPQKVDRLYSQASLLLATLANEPSVGLYHVQDHVVRVVPSLVDAKQTIDASTERIRGFVVDVEYSNSVLDDLM